MREDELKNVPFEQAVDARRRADADDFRRLEEIQREALREMLTLAQKKGAGQAELEAMQNSMQEPHQKQREELSQMHRDRMDRLVIRYKGKDAGLDKEHERER